MEADKILDFDRQKVDYFYESCFKDSKKYRGTDTHVPSKFVENLKVKILFHELLKQQRGNGKRHTERIFIVNEEDLKYDLYA